MKKRLPVLTLVVGCLTIPGIVHARQAAPDRLLADVRQDVAREIVEDDVPFSVNRFLDYIAIYVNRSGALVKLLQQYEEERSDEQLGASSSAAGTTTLVSKGTVPKILALAVENGAVTRAQSGTTVTFRANVGGSMQALAGKGFLQLTPVDDPAAALLSRLSLSASFDTSRGAAAGGNTLTADQQQLSQWTGRLELVNQRDLRSRRTAQRWTTALSARLTSVSAVSEGLRNLITAEPAFQTWERETAAAVEKVRTSDAGRPADARISSLTEVLASAEGRIPLPADLSTETRAALSTYDQSTSEFAMARQEVLRDIRKGLLATFEYTNDRPLKGPQTSNARLVGAVGGAVDLTGNASVTVFDSIPMGVTRRVRDYQLAGQIDVKMGTALSAGAYILSLSGKWVRQLEDSVSDAGVVLPGTKGSIATGQLKLTIPVKGSGARIPLSLTFANRTDLIKERIVRGNVGVSFDLDTVFARFKP
jgi:hypothetical protein